MLRGRLLALAGVALLASPLAAESPDPYEAKVRALAHPRYAEREKSARQLAAAGLTEDDSAAPAQRADGVYSTGGRRMMVRSHISARPGADVTRLIDGVAPPSATGQVFRVRALPAGYGPNKYDDLKGEVTFHL